MVALVYNECIFQISHCRHTRCETRIAAWHVHCSGHVWRTRSTNPGFSGNISKFDDLVVTDERSETAENAMHSAGSLLDRLRLAVLAELEEDERNAQAVKKRSRASREKQGTLITGVAINPSGRLSSEMIFRATPPEEYKATYDVRKTKFKEGQSVCLMAERSEQISIEGSVLSLEGGDVWIAMSNDASMKLIGLMKSIDSRRFNLEVGHKSVTAERQLKALDEMGSKMEGKRRGARSMRAILLGSPKLKALAALPPEWMGSRSCLDEAKKALKELKHLNESQRTAIATALARTLTCWQGPPGTGKTRTLLGLAFVLSKIINSGIHRRQQIGKILAVAETNAAADNLLHGLSLLKLKVVRLGSPSKIRPELRHLELEAQAEMSASGRNAGRMRDEATQMMLHADKCRQSGELGAKKEASDLHFSSQHLWKAAEREMEQAIEYIMQESDIVVATCVSAGDPRLSKYDFRVVIIDEASQASHPSTLISVTKGAECVVMAGDHAQLPPTVISRKAESLGLSISLFSHLQIMGLESILLKVQYRMHPQLNSFPSMQFYSGKVISGVRDHQRPLIKGIEWETPKMPAKFVECESSELRVSTWGTLNEVRDTPDQLKNSQGTSFSNPQQCDLALSLANSALNDPSVRNCVILTPYAGQLALLKKKVSNASELQDTACSGRLLLSTIDGFQGREADLVILSTVRCNEEGALGFVKDKRRMNVAITRGRRGLVIIGSKATLSSDPLWAAWIAWTKHSTTH